MNTSQACAGVVTMQTNHGFYAACPAMVGVGLRAQNPGGVSFIPAGLQPGEEPGDVGGLVRWDGWAARAGEGMDGLGGQRPCRERLPESGGPLAGRGQAARCAPSRASSSVCSFPLAQFRHEVMP